MSYEVASQWSIRPCSSPVLLAFASSGVNQWDIATTNKGAVAQKGLFGVVL